MPDEAELKRQKAVVEKEQREREMEVGSEELSIKCEASNHIYIVL